MPNLEIEPGAHRWEARAVTTTPPRLFTARLDFTSNIPFYFVHALEILYVELLTLFYLGNLNAKSKREVKIKIGKLQQHTSC